MIEKYYRSLGGPRLLFLLLLLVAALVPSITALWLPPNSPLRHTFSLTKHHSNPKIVKYDTNTLIKTRKQQPRHSFDSPLPYQSTSHTPSSSSSLSFSLEDMIYNAQSTASSLASSSLSNFYSSSSISSPSSSVSSSLTSLIILYFAGLLTSFSPCSLGLLPLTMSYISNAADQRQDKTVILPTLAFASGLASVFCTLGLISSLVGGVFGSSTSSGAGAGASESLSFSSIWGTFLLASLSSGISIAMGLQLLELIKLPLPSLDFVLQNDETNNGGIKGITTSSSSSVNVNNAMGAVGGGDVVCNDTVCYNSSSSEISFDEEGNIVYIPPSTKPTTTTTTTTNTPATSTSTKDNVNSIFRTFLLGGSSALVASPCATPVLTSILAFVATSQDPILGATLLFTYTIGYSTPLLVVAASGGQALVNLQNNGGSGDESWMMTRLGQWVNPLTASVLIWYGTNGFLEALLGDPSIAGLAPILD